MLPFLISLSAEMGKFQLMVAPRARGRPVLSDRAVEPADALG